MSRRVTVVLLILVAAFAVTGLSVLLAVRLGTPTVEAERSRPVTAARPVSIPAARRGAPGLTVQDAIKELDLIRPARTKLADDFALPTPDGKRFRLGDQRGKVVFVNFWATWCPPCREEMPAMEQLYRQHKDEGLVIVAVSVDSDPALVTPFVKKHGFTFPVAVDPKMEVANAYGVRALPSTFLVDREGQMAALALGARAWDGEISHSLFEGLLR